MKIDRSRARKSTTDIPTECIQLIERLQQCSYSELLDELSAITSWTYGKCELLHWAPVLDIFDKILGSAAEASIGNKWALRCENYGEKDKLLLISILRFTSLLIEHSFSRHLYNSMEHLLVLLSSSDMSVVLEVLNLLYMFSKRSNFITRLKTEEKECLLSRLQYLAENWGGKENGFGLAHCCKPHKTMPASATTLHVEFHKDEIKSKTQQVGKSNICIIHIEHVDKINKTPASIMKSLMSMYSIPVEKEVWLFTHVRLAINFSNYEKRLKCVQARLQALSVLVYSNAIQDSPSNLLYSGLLEELVEVVQLQYPHVTDIRCAALRTLTAIIHLDRNTQFPNRRAGARLNSIIDVTGASQYHGFLPTLVRNCITSLTSTTQEVVQSDLKSTNSLDKSGSSKTLLEPGTSSIENSDDDSSFPAGTEVEEEPDQIKFPVSLTTALFSFLYHLASYDVGGEALVSCGMMESLLQVINWHGYELDHITFVTRAVRVIDLITNIDMQAFQAHGGLNSFINRLDLEVGFCKSEQLYSVKTNQVEQNFEESPAQPANEDLPVVELEAVNENAGKTCLPQRAALLKSLLNFLKKAFQDSAFAESIRHLMEGPLPNALKNIIANAEYYGPSLFLLATDVVTVYVYQEPALLSALQDNGLTSIVMHALLVKEVPCTREVLGSLPNVFSALCLNARGLEAFAKHKPFERLFYILVSPAYLPAMRRRRSSEPQADTACNLGSAMDELMRHQPSLRQDATIAIISLLEELVFIGSDPKYVCWRPHTRVETVTTTPGRTTTTEGSSDEEEEEEEETSTSSQNANAQVQSENGSTSQQNNPVPVGNERQPIALIDYVLNTMKFIDAILSNNSTDDHCREFVQKGGLKPLLRLLGLPNLPADCPVTNTAQAVATVCKSILNLAHEPFIFQEGLQQLSEVLDRLKPLCSPSEEPRFMGGSRLLAELARTPDPSVAFNSAKGTPLLHAMGAAHGYVLMFVHVCRTGQTEIRSLSLQHWGKKEGIKVLKGLAELYTALVWESTLLLAYCSEDLIPGECDFTRENIERLNIFFERCEASHSTGTETSSPPSTIDMLCNSHPHIDLDAQELTKSDRNLKFIKPLLGASSRLGRALAELFGLLVKLCVGSPARQRRGQNSAATPPPSVHAKKVALALNALLAKGLDSDSLPPSPNKKCRLTFLVCSVGFTSPMLFDERRYPYYLMLKKFVSMGGQATFFKCFKWALGRHSDGPTDIASLPEGTLGFLDAWLNLLEKMVNPKTILESPHIISNRPNAAYNFDAVKYLIQVHRLAFDSIEKLWKHIPITAYGPRISEAILVILKHIFAGEKVIRDKLKQDDARSDQAASSTAQAANRDSDDNLRHLIDMGFTREHALEALLHSNNLEQATDYLLSNPPNSRASNSNMEVEVSEDDQVMQAIAISLGSNNTPDNPHATLEEMRVILDKFTENALEMGLDAMQKLPDLTYKICELLVTIMKRNGKTFRDNLLETFVKKIYLLANELNVSSRSRTDPKSIYEALTNTEDAKVLGYYLHLFILFYEVASYYEMKLPCMATYGTRLMNLIIKLIARSQLCMSHLAKETPNIAEPHWLPAGFIFLDSYSKVANRTDRKYKMHMSTSRVWRWYDLVTGRWTDYTPANNRIINEAYWSGEQTVRVTCGRKRYTITFPNMLQMNEETGNNRPIAMTLLTITHPCVTLDAEVPQSPLFAELTRKERNRCIPVPPLSKRQIKIIVKCCARLLHQQTLTRELLHAILQVCVRFTRDYEMAKEFVNAGGITRLLTMKRIADFGGFGVLATIIIRHALEEPNILTYAMEKVLRGRVQRALPPPYRELIYLSRQLGAAITRAPEVFFTVSKNILRVDITAAKPGDTFDSAFPLRAIPMTKPKAPPLEDPVSIQVVYDLLDALVMPLSDKPASKDGGEEGQGDADKAKPSKSKKSSGSQSKPGTSGTSGTQEEKDDEVVSPMLSKSVVLKILADAVVSYGPIAKLITEYTYQADRVECIIEDTTALAFIFDKILPETENISDSDCSTMCRILIASLASANHSPEAQMILVNEVKAALGRALALSESSEKHNHVQQICGIISTMIDNCPIPPRGVNSAPLVNNIIKLMIRRGLVSDLAKIMHSLDLSSPHTPFTANAALKPLESLSRTINQPGPTTAVAKGRKSVGTDTEELSASANPQSEPTRILEEEDTENAEDAQSEAATERNEGGEGQRDRDRLEEIMEQILDGTAEAIRSTMDIDDESYDPERDPTEELMSTDSGESDSNPSDDNDDDGNNDDDDGVDVNMEDNDDNDDNNYEDEDDNNERGGRGQIRDSQFRTSRVFRVDHEEDVLMIHYEGENETPLPRMVRWNENGYAVPMLDDNSGDHAIIHPLLLQRTGPDSTQNSITRNQRTNRPRRYQYLFNPRNANPPVILQRLLGTHDPHAMANMMTANNILAAPTDATREQARVVIMDNFGIIPPNEEQIDFVDQSGYLFGPSLAATLSHVPPVVHWWNMESKLLDLESVFDCTSWICNQLMPSLLKYRNDELNVKQVRADEEKARKRKFAAAGSSEASGENKNDKWELPELPDDGYEANDAYVVNYSDGENDPNSQDRTERREQTDETIPVRIVGNPSPGRDPIVVMGVPCRSRTYVINYPSDSNSGDSSSNRDADENSEDRQDSRADVDDIFVERNREDIDGVPVEPSNASSNSNASQPSTQNEMVVSPLQMTFRAAGSSSSQPVLQLGQASALVQTHTSSGVSTERTEDSNSRADSENSMSDIFPPNMSPIYPHVTTTPRLHGSPASLQAIFEEAINQHIEEYTATRDRDRVPTEGTSSSSSSEPQSQADESRPESEGGSSVILVEPEPRDLIETPVVNVEPSAPPTAAGPSSAPDDEEIPEGVDPSFLEALPPEIRREVLEQHRILSRQQRLAARAAETATTSSNTEEEASTSAEAAQEVSPEFLAALPPALQEEVLTQQRLEQQRQAAARAPPNEPVDAHAFFQTLQPSLRTMILSDMEDSQMSALPPELAAEAQNLRRDWYARNRQLAQERFLQSSLPTLIRRSRVDRQGQGRPITFQRGGWSQWSRDFMSNTSSARGTTNLRNLQMRIRGRQLLDHEGIACLLILLFTDDPHLNKLRLHRVIRNLCYHAPTRDWIINALLTIVNKSVRARVEDIMRESSRKGPRAGPLTSKLQTDLRHVNVGGNWLTIRMEAALGCAAYVFSVNKSVGKRCSGYQAIGIHPQAAPVVCRNALDIFTALAKAFPTCILPIKVFRDDSVDRSPLTPVKVSPAGQPDFWDTLLKLDSAGAKKGKSIAKAVITSTNSDNDNIYFNNTVFGRLMNMLGSQIVNQNVYFTDSLLKLLSVTTSGMPELIKPLRLKKGSVFQPTIEQGEDSSIYGLTLAVKVISKKCCSEEGLEFLTSLLMNISSASLETGFMIMNLLLAGVVEIGRVVEEQIKSMHADLEEFLQMLEEKEEREKESGPSTSKGVIFNRFTNEQIIVTASSKVKASCELQLPSMRPLTCKGSSQSYFLRVLRLIVQIRNAFINTVKRNNISVELTALNEHLKPIENLWNTLSLCLLELEHARDHHAVLVLQPAVEAFFLVHSPQQATFLFGFDEIGTPSPPGEIGNENTESSSSTSGDAQSESEPAAAPTAGEEPPAAQEEASRSSFDFDHRHSDTNRQITPEQQKFLAFAEKHRTVLNQILRQSSAHLADGPFAVLVDHTRILDFDIKRRYFRTELERMDHGIRREETAVHVRRNNVFEDSFRELFRRPPEEWKNRFYIVFEEEEGQDAGGLLREWYVIISRDIFNPMYALFTVSPGDRVTYMINSASHYNSNHLCYYKFVGRVIAKAIYDNKLLECYFTRSFYKHILGIPVKYTDMESEDYSFYRGLVYLMENNINNLGLDLTFSTEISEFGVTETRDLIPNGRHIPVTEDNKMEYVRLVCQMKMTGAIKQQLTAFLEGFYDIIPMRLISIFNEQELELLISGLPNIDIDDLKGNTEYHKYQSNSLQIQWFWRALRAFDQADRAKFLQFVTGTSKVPLQGFGALEGMNGVQKFQIHRDDRSTDRLPSAHTCFNQLDLPVYETYDKLKAYLLKAIHECSEGFGFA